MKKKETGKVKTLGQRIKTLRGDLTQVDFASAIGIKQAMVSRYEADKETPSPRTLLAIARYGGKTVEWMLTGQDSLFQQAERPDKPNLTREDLFAIASQDLVNTHDPAAKEFVDMMNDLFNNRRRLERVFDFYRFIKRQD